MKQIVSLFFTFLGICVASAQDLAQATVSDTVPTKGIYTSNLKDTVVVKKAPVIKLLNNPVKNKAEIAIDGFSAGEVQVILLDSKANKLKDDRRLVFGGSDVITVMFSLPTGIYFIAVRQKGILLSRKMLVR